MKTNHLALSPFYGASNLSRRRHNKKSLTDNRNRRPTVSAGTRRCRGTIHPMKTPNTPNMKKQWRAEQCRLKKDRRLVDQYGAGRIKHIWREIAKLRKEAVRVNKSARSHARKIDRRIAILEGRLS
jgi:hypothetical protein